MTPQQQEQQSQPQQITTTTSKDNQNKNKVNLLIINPSPRKIKLFEDKLKEINQKYDVFRIKNDFDELNAYRCGRAFFLSHTEYTHLAILPDDLLIEVEDIDNLVRDISINQDKYPVLSGICNFAYSSKNFFNRMAIIKFSKYETVETIKRIGRYKYPNDILDREEYQKLSEKEKIIRVAFAGFPFTIIRRDIVERIDFSRNIMGIDLAFCRDCLINNIEMYVNLTAESLHMKGMEDNRDMKHVYEKAFRENIDTKVHKGTLTNPAKRAEIFLPAKIKESEVEIVPISK